MQSHRKRSWNWKGKEREVRPMGEGMMEISMGVHEENTIM